MTAAKRILLAEDDEDDRDFFMKFLHDREDIAEINFVENGLDLIELLLNIPPASLPDIIILDQNMPKMTGLQTLIILQSDPAFKTIPVMVYSTYASEALLSSCLENGAVYVSGKPATKAEYYKMMDEFFKAIG